MKSVKQYTYEKLIQLLLGKNVHMTSDCEFFPNFNITGKVLEYRITGTELVFKVNVNGKKIDVGSNMKNLKFEIVK